MGLTRYEQEVVINFNAEEDKAILYTANPVWIRKFDKLVESNPNDFKFVKSEKLDGQIVSKTYKFPKRFVSIRSKDVVRQLSEEQRNEIANRLKGN